MMLHPGPRFFPQTPFQRRRTFRSGSEHLAFRLVTRTLSSGRSRCQSMRTSLRLDRGKEGELLELVNITRQNEELRRGGRGGEVEIERTIHEECALFGRSKTREDLRICQSLLSCQTHCAMANFTEKTNKQKRTKHLKSRRMLTTSSSQASEFAACLDRRRWRYPGHPLPK